MTYNREGELSFHNHGKPRATPSTKKMCATLVALDSYQRLSTSLH